MEKYTEEQGWQSPVFEVQTKACTLVLSYGIRLSIWPYKDVMDIANKVYIRI